MTTDHEFTLTIIGFTDDLLDAIYEATDGGRATVSSNGQTAILAYTWPDDTFAEAVLDAITRIETVAGIEVTSVDPDQFVWASEIAERTGRSRQSVDHLVKGVRGPGNFPSPLTGSTRNPLWRWADVEEWFGHYEHRTVDTERHAVIGAINGALEARRNLHRIPDLHLTSQLEALIGA